MNWVNKQKLPAIKTIKYNNQLCFEINNLWHILHSSFNTAHHCFINKRVLDEILAFPTAQWNGFSEEEFIIAITKCNNTFASRPDKLSWSHLKHILKDKICLYNVIKIANSCFDLGFWPFLLWDTLDTNNFYFILFYFSDFILILFFFCFSFSFRQ